jgi:hypothetical protein
MIPGPLPLIPDVLRLNGRWRRERAAVTCGDTTLTWGEFDSASNSASRASSSVMTCREIRTANC